MPVITTRPSAVAALPARARWAALLSLLVMWAAGATAHAQLPIDIHRPAEQGVEWRAKALAHRLADAGEEVHQPPAGPRRVAGRAVVAESTGPTRVRSGPSPLMAPDPTGRPP